MSDTRTLTIDEAMALLPEGDTIHTFLGVCGADWGREELIEAIRESKGYRTTNGHAAALGHGLAIERKGRILYVQTREVPDA